MSADGMNKKWAKANEYERLEIVLTCVGAGHLESAKSWLSRDPKLNTFFVQLKTATDQIELLENMLKNQIGRLHLAERVREARVEEIRCDRRAVLQAEIDERQKQIDDRRERIKRLRA